LLLACGATALLLPPSGHAEIQIEGTRFVYSAADRDISIGLRNLAKATPSLVQAWVDDGASSVAPARASAPFSLTPPMFRLEGGKGQRLRLVYTGEPLPADRESLFWLNVLEVPPQPEASQGAGRNLLQLAVRSRMKLFYRPRNLPGDAATAGASLTWRLEPGGGKGVYRLLARNASAYYVSLSQAKIDVPGADVRIGDGIVGPGEEAGFELRGAKSLSLGSFVVTYSYLDDFGAERSTQATVKP